MGQIFIFNVYKIYLKEKSKYLNLNWYYLFRNVSVVHDNFCHGSFHVSDITLVYHFRV